MLDLLGLAIPDRFCKLEAGNQPFSKPLKGIGTPRLARGDKLHHKFAVIDNRKVITGSFNWSPSAAHTNDETLLVIHSPILAAHFTREMDRLWRGAELGITQRTDTYTLITTNSHTSINNGNITIETLFANYCMPKSASMRP